MSYLNEQDTNFIAKSLSNQTEYLQAMIGSYKVRYRKDDLNPVKPFSNYELIANNTKILQSLQHTNSNILLFLKALHIKFKRPALNSGLKASKKLMLFL